MLMIRIILTSITGSFIHNNYKQALGILNTAPALARTMIDLGVANEAVFEEWLKEEHKYLSSLSSEPLTETLEMEYYQKLIKLQASK